MKKILLSILPLLLIVACGLLPEEEDCAGTEGGEATVDGCGTCTGGTTGLLPNYQQDCDGVCFGTAVTDNCDQCVDGNTGEIACIEDCNLDFGGTAFENECGCVGGSTELDEYYCYLCIDTDGNEYETVEIGEQVWMAENLKVTHYRNGDEIPTGYSNDEWANLSTGAYAVYDDNESNADTYGYLYNWYAVDDERGVCPASWHVPTHAEYTVLIDYLGGTIVAGGKMKEEDHEHWNYYNEQITSEATNESGFTGLPAGYRDGDVGYYNKIYDYGCFWSSSSSGDGAYRLKLEHYKSTIDWILTFKDTGYSVRCLRDF